MGGKFSEWLISIVFSIVGVIFIVVGIIALKSTSDFKKTAVETTAEVISVSKQTDSDGDTSYTVYVTYNVNGQIYDNHYSTSTFIREGSTVKVYYDKNNPSKMRSTTSSIFGIVGTVVGTVFAAIGFGILFGKYKSKNKKKDLLENGQRIDADFQEVIINRAYSVNNRNPFKVICQGKDLNGEICSFESENIWYNPEKIIEENNITTFPVYIDMNNPKRYYLSLEEIEEKK